jgi:hypothetical protein
VKKKNGAMIQSSADTAGMSLLEVVIALLIFTIGLLGVASMQLTGMRTSARAGQGAWDGTIASSRIEEMLSWSYDDPRMADPDDGFQPRLPDHGPYPIGHPAVTIEWEVDDGRPRTNMKSVQVTVRRQRGDGETMVQTYRYLKPKRSVVTVRGGEAR